MTDLIKGTTLNINSATSSAETISASYDADLAEMALQVMVDQINTLGQSLKDLSKRGATGEDDGPLAGDAYVMLLRRQLRTYTTTPISGFGDTDIYMADFGVTTDLDGTISLDSAKFQSTYSENPDAFAALTTSRITTGSELVEATWLALIQKRSFNLT